MRFDVRSGVQVLFLVLLLSPQVLPGQGGPTPMDAAAAMSGRSLDGDWKNLDPATRGLVRIVVNGDKVHPFGACHPRACDWGSSKAQPFASKVDASDLFSLMASVRTKFNRTILTISLEDDGRLRVQSFTHFTDRTNRADYSNVSYFVRSS